MSSLTLNSCQRPRSSVCRSVKDVDFSPAINPLFSTVLVIWVVCVATPQFDQLIFYGASFILTAILGLYCAAVTHKPLEWSWKQVLLLVTIAVAGFRSDQALHASVYIGKLSIIFFALTGLKARHGSGTVLCRALLINGYIHAMTLVLLTFGNLSVLAGGRGGHGRTGTILAWPGALWHSAVFGIAYYFYVLLASKNIRVRYFIPLILFGYVVWQDGTRTGALLLPAVLLFWWSITNISKKKFLNVSLAGLIFVTICFLSVAFFPSLYQTFMDNGAIVRMAAFFDTNGDFYEKLTALDAGRMLMVETAIQNITSNPILGAGLFQTVIRVPNDIEIRQDVMSVHNAYLQVWGDMGVFGFISFCGIVLCWLKHIKPAISNIQNGSDIVGQGFLFASLCSVSVFCLSLLMHPFTVVLQDWVYLIVPTIYLAQRATTFPEAFGITRE